MATVRLTEFSEYSSEILRFVVENAKFSKNLYQNQLVGVEATENDRMSGGISSIFYCLEHQIIVR